MIRRLRAWVHAWLIALDQLAYVTLAGPTDPAPSPYETISSRVGRAANDGLWWGKLLQPAIDRLFMLLGSDPGHCQRSIVRADWIASTLP